MVHLKCIITHYVTMHNMIEQVLWIPSMVRFVMYKYHL